MAQPTANAAGDGTFGLGRRGRLIVSGAEVRILFPALFAGRPMTFAIDDIAVAIAEPEEIAERFPDGFTGDCDLPNLAHLGRQSRRKRSNLLLVFAKPTLLPPLSLRGRVTAPWYWELRREPFDGFFGWAREPHDLVDGLVRHGVLRTSTPLTWVYERRGQTSPLEPLDAP